MSKVLSKQSGYQQLFQAKSSSNTQQYDYFQPPDPTKRLYSQQQHTSAFYKDHVQQQYAIQRAFKSNNFTYLRNLPQNFKYGEILNERKQKAIKQNNIEAQKRSMSFYEKQTQRNIKAKQLKKQQIGTLGYFNIFPYQESNYQIPKILKNIQKLQADNKRKQISQLDFRPAGIQTKMKYENPFQYVDKIMGKNQNNQYIYPFHLSNDTYDCFHESELRKKIISDSLKINGDFLPSKKQHTLSSPNRGQLGQIIKQIQLFLKKYFKQLPFFIGVNSQDHIQILFQEKYKDNSKVAMIMSKICEHQTMCKFILRRNLQRWGIMDNEKGYFIFSMLPHWVKNSVQSLKKKKQ